MTQVRLLLVNYSAKITSSLGLMIRDIITEKTMTIGRAASKVDAHTEVRWFQSVKLLVLMVVITAIIDSIVTAIHKPKTTFILTFEILGNIAAKAL